MATATRHSAMTHMTLLRGFLAAAMAALLIQTGSPAMARTWPESCPRLTGTFIQPLMEQGSWTQNDWNALMAELDAVGVETLYLQWTQLDRFNVFEEGSRQDLAAPIIERVLAAAEAYGIKLWLGLVYDPGYWDRIRQEAPLVEVYLRRHRVSNLELVNRLNDAAGASPAFAGWYITEEIDDVTWQDVAKKNLLIEHLAATVADIRTVTPAAPIAISGFTSATLDPAALADFWFDLLSQSGIDVFLMQDGYGVHQGNILPEDMAIYMQSLRDAAQAAGAQFGVIVELFTQVAGQPINDEPFAAVPAGFDRLPEQLALAADFSDQRIGFSMPEYMSSGGPPSAGALYRDYVLWLLDTCGAGN